MVYHILQPVESVLKGIDNKCFDDMASRFQAQRLK